MKQLNNLIGGKWVAATGSESYTLLDPSDGRTPVASLRLSSTSDVSAAQVWQFAQSPRRKQFSAHCPPGYHQNGNCYSPADTSFSWELDVDTATSADPSNGARP